MTDDEVEKELRDFMYVAQEAQLRSGQCTPADLARWQRMLEARERELDARERLVASDGAT